MLFGGEAQDYGPKERNRREERKKKTPSSDMPHRKKDWEMNQNL